MIGTPVALYGTDEPLPARRLLRAGPVSATLENGALRWIRFGDVEVLRGIAFLVRDRAWGTPTPEITGLKVEDGAGGFRVTFDALCRTDDGDLPWSAEISGSADGTLRFAATARPAADFATNRTGFVILHPLDGVAGFPVEVAEGDGQRRQARFPTYVDPEPCFSDIRSLAHEVAPGIVATCTMEGDLWEMEDHRNWLDASFKTYVRPLRFPYPYVLKGGEAVGETVTLAFSGTVAAPAVRRSEPPLAVALGRETGRRVPAIGLRAPLQWAEAARATAARIRPQLVNGRIDPRAGHGAAEMAKLQSIADAAGAGLTLELVVPCRADPPAEVRALADALAASGARPESIMIAAAEDRIRQEPGPPSPPLAMLAEIHHAAREAFPGMPIGGGTFGFFTELNRNWPPAGLIDYVAHTVCSTVHASDDRSMMENLATFPHVFRTVRAFAGGLPYRLIAAGIGLETGTADRPAAPLPNRRNAMARMDPRQRGLFGAGWTLGAIAAATEGGLAAITPAALAGEFGMAHAAMPWEQPWFDAAAAGAVFPVFHVVSAIAAASGAPEVAATPSDPGRIAALAWRSADGPMQLWLANLTETPQRVALDGFSGELRASVIDAARFETAAKDAAHADLLAPLFGGAVEMGAYAILHVEGNG